MNNKTKGQKLFILCISLTLVFSFMCFVGCGGSCMGCILNCESVEGGCVSGIGYVSEGDGCDNASGCLSTASCIEMRTPEAEDEGDMIILSCQAAEDGCGGGESCYNGLFCGGCGSCGDCGVFFGGRDGHDVDETSIGCLDGCITCKDTSGLWGSLLNALYNALDI